MGLYEKTKFGTEIVFLQNDAWPCFKYTLMPLVCGTSPGVPPRTSITIHELLYLNFWFMKHLFVAMCT